MRTYIGRISLRFLILTPLVHSDLVGIPSDQEVLPGSPFRRAPCMCMISGYRGGKQSSFFDGWRRSERRISWRCKMHGRKSGCLEVPVLIQRNHIRKQNWMIWNRPNALIAVGTAKYSFINLRHCSWVMSMFQKTTITHRDPAETLQDWQWHSRYHGHGWFRADHRRGETTTPEWHLP